MIIDIYLYIYTYMYKAYKDNRSMAAEIRLLFLQEELKRQDLCRRADRGTAIRLSLSAVFPMIPSRNMNL
jgi:hypothetical protein